MADGRCRKDGGEKCHATPYCFFAGACIWVETLEESSG